MMGLKEKKERKPRKGTPEMLSASMGRDASQHDSKNNNGQRVQLH